MFQILVAVLLLLALLVGLNRQLCLEACARIKPFAVGCVELCGKTKESE